MATGRPSPPTSRFWPAAGRVAAPACVACLLGIIAPACGDPLPGAPLGTFQVTAMASANTCGLGAPSVYQFDVQLSRLGDTLYWSWLTLAPIASGTLAPVSATDARLSASLHASQSANVDGTDAGAGPCTMTRTDSLVVTLGATSPPGTFTGTMDYGFTAAAGSDCSDQLVAAGGMYTELPCSVTYVIAATRR